MKRIIVTLISALGLCAMASAQDATVSDVWLEHNVYKSTGYYNQTVKVRFFKRFDEVVVTDMSKHAGKGAMDTKLGT